MSCSKEIRYPSSWVKIQEDVLMNTQDERYICYDEFVNWVLECELCDEVTLEKNYKKIHPCQCMLASFPIRPDNILCRELFKLYVEFLVALYVIDDKLEKDCTLEDVEKAVNAYDELDEKLNKTFPKLPSIEDLKKSLDYLKNKTIISSVTICLDWVNRCTSAILQHANAPIDAIFDYRQRMSNTVSLYLQATASEKRVKSEDTENKILWKRLFAATPCFSIFAEICANALGKTSPHITTITEMYILSAMFASLVNDIYSYHKETNATSVVGDNLIRFWLQKNEVASVSEGIARAISILQETVKYLYQLTESTKEKYPNSPELHALLDCICNATSGWHLFHECNDRYKDSPFRLSYVDLEGRELQEWVEDKDSYGWEWEVVKQFLYKNNKEAKKLNDALSGVTSAHGKFI